MSQKEAKELLDYLEALQNDYTQRISEINSKLARLSRAILANGELNEIVQDIKSSVGECNNTDNESLEQENIRLKKTIKNLEEDKLEHKSNYHCLQRVKFFQYYFFSPNNSLH